MLKAGSIAKLNNGAVIRATNKTREYYSVRFKKKMIGLVCEVIGEIPTPFRCREYLYSPDGLFAGEKSERNKKHPLHVKSVATFA